MAPTQRETDGGLQQIDGGKSERIAQFSHLPLHVYVGKAGLSRERKRMFLVERLAGAERETAIIIARNVRHAAAGVTRCGVALYGRNPILRVVVEIQITVVTIAPLGVETICAEAEAVVPSRLQSGIINDFLHGVSRIRNGEQLHEVGTSCPSTVGELDVVLLREFILQIGVQRSIRSVALRLKAPVATLIFQALIPYAEGGQEF